MPKKAAIFSSTHSSNSHMIILFLPFVWALFAFSSPGRFFCSIFSERFFCFSFIDCCCFCFSKNQKDFLFQRFYSLSAWHSSHLPLLRVLSFLDALQILQRRFRNLGILLMLLEWDSNAETVNSNMSIATQRSRAICYGGRGRLFLVNIIFIFSSWLFLLVYPLAHGVCVSCIAFFLFFFHCDVRHLLS